MILTTLLIAVVSMAFAAHQWWRGYHIMAIGFITFALVMAGVAIEAAKDNQNAEARVVGSALSCAGHRPPPQTCRRFVAGSLLLRLRRVFELTSFSRVEAVFRAHLGDDLKILAASD
jgi:hypothetical protein